MKRVHTLKPCISLLIVEKKYMLENHQGSVYSCNVLSHLNSNVYLLMYVYGSCKCDKETLPTGPFLRAFTIKI